MAFTRRNNGRQWPLVAELVLELGKHNLTDVNGLARPLNGAGELVSDVIKLPPGAVVIGGDITVEQPSDDGGAPTVAVGDPGDPNRYRGPTSLTAASYTPLIITGYRTNGEDIRLTFAGGSGGAAAGRVAIRVMYVVLNRENENQPT